MISEKTLQLLTAFVDGELSPHERKLAARILNISSEARQVVKDLQANVHRLQQLPRRKLEPEFAEQIVRLIKERAAPRTTIPIAEPVDAPPGTIPILRRWSRWSRYAVAASILIIAAVGVYFATRSGDPVDLALNADADKVQKQGIDYEATIAKVIEGVANEYAKVAPPERTGTRFAFADLKQEKQAARLGQEFVRTKAVHLEIGVKDRGEAVRRLDRALRNQGISLRGIDAAIAKLKGEEAKTEYVVFAENITPAELTRLLSELSQATTFETMTVSAVNDQDQQQVCQLLGIGREELLTPRKTADPFPTFVEKKGEKKGNNPGIANINPTQTPTPALRTAVVLASDGGAGRASSDVIYFRGQRRELQPGTLQVVLVIHHT
jgi:hypothetical protein